MIQVEPRASTILFKFLVSNCLDYHFIIPANVCSVVPLTFLSAGVEFSFVDIDIATHAGSFEEYKKRVLECKDKKVGVLFVNAYGFYHDTKQFYRDLRILRSDILIIEDNCLCVPLTGQTNPDVDVDMEFYSTGFSKFVQMPMNGGFGMIRDGLAYNIFESPFDVNGYSEQLLRVKESRKSGRLFQYEENNWLPVKSFLTDSYTIDDYFREVEWKANESKKHKQVINQVYDDSLPEELKMGECFNTWRYNLLLPSQALRDAILNALFAENLYASPHFQSGAYLFKHIHCINAENDANRILNLFNEEKYTVEMAKRTTEIIIEIYKDYDK